MLSKKISPIKAAIKIKKTSPILKRRSLEKHDKIKRKTITYRSLNYKTFKNNTVKSPIKLNGGLGSIKVKKEKSKINVSN